MGDRFADYGLVGVAIVEGDQLDSFVLSCRVMGLGGEDAFLRSVLASEAARRPTGVLQARYLPTERNKPCAKLLPANGFESLPDADDGAYVYPLAKGVQAPPAHCRVDLDAAEVAV
ncbi:hypothetical protein D3C72_2209680 [compost metagenome]